MAILRRREDDPPTTVEDEREALRRQREQGAAEIDALKRELAERVAAVAEREKELQRLAANGSGAAVVAAQPDVDVERVLVARAAELDRRERDVAAREATLDEDTAENALAMDGRRGELARLSEELDEREAAVAAVETRLADREADLDEREAAPPPPGSKELQMIEARLAVLKEAELAFGRTQQELAARSEALTARERLIAQKERELDDQEDSWGLGPKPTVAVTDLEARLRKLEQGQGVGEQTQSFSGGVKKLSNEGTRRSR